MGDIRMPALMQHIYSGCKLFDAMHRCVLCSQFAIRVLALPFAFQLVTCAVSVGAGGTEFECKRMSNRSTWCFKHTCTECLKLLTACLDHSLAR
jgi:hypothetical protein